MALTVEVTKKAVTTSQDGLFQITLNMKYLDGATVLIDQDFTENHWLGQPPSVAVGRFKERMQKTIDNYKASQGIFNAAALDTALTTLKNGLVV